MKKRVVRLTESDLQRIVKRVIKENMVNELGGAAISEINRCIDLIMGATTCRELSQIRQQCNVVTLLDMGDENVSEWMDYYRNNFMPAMEEMGNSLGCYETVKKWKD